MRPAPPTADYLTDLGYKMLEIIEVTGDSGITRPSIAKALGKKRLCLWDEAQLQRLETDELITVSMLQNGRWLSVKEFIYRATQQ